MALQHSQDLTGQVVRVEPFCFALDGNVEIWRGCCFGNGASVVVKVPRGTAAEIEALKIRLESEASVWMAVAHPYVTPLFGISSDFDRPGIPCLISPYYRHGTIISYIKEHSNIAKLPLIAQVASALSYLHSESIIHGDLRGSNVLINDNLQASLVDFGLSCILHESGLTAITQEGWGYKAPEQLVIGEKEWPRATKAADVWAFAMTVVEIFTGYLPLSQTNNFYLIPAVMAGHHPEREECPLINDEIWEMLERCWEIDPTRRPSMATLSSFFSLQSVLLSVQHARL